MIEVIEGLRIAVSSLPPTVDARYARDFATLTAEGIKDSQERARALQVINEGVTLTAVSVVTGEEEAELWLKLNFPEFDQFPERYKIREGFPYLGLSLNEHITVVNSGVQLMGGHSLAGSVHKRLSEIRGRIVTANQKDALNFFSKVGDQINRREAFRGWA